MLTIHDWFSLVKNNDLRKHLLERLEEDTDSKDKKAYSFSSAIHGAFPWGSEYTYYASLYNNPPELKNVMIYKIKKFLKEIK